MTLRCDLCGEAPFAVEPGSEELRDLFLLEKGAPLRCWCFEHWRIAQRAEQLGELVPMQVRLS